MTTEQYPKVYLYKRIVQAKLFIDSNYTDNIDLDNISDEAYFSKFHFIRLFKNAYGKTPHQYLTSVRIEKAKQMLQLGKTVSFTCNALSFESLGSFSRLFKQIAGISPSAYIEQQKEIRNQTKALPLSFIPNCFAQHYGWSK
ncbi:MAG: AraC family transcriptional regulator [Ferruginibacter sp.]